MDYMIYVWGILEAIIIYLLLFIYRPHIIINKNLEKEIDLITIEDSDKELINNEILSSEAIKNKELFDFDKNKVSRYITIVLLSLIAMICAFFASKITPLVMDSIKLMVVYIGVSIAMLIDRKTRLIPNLLIFALLITRLIIFGIEFFVTNEIIMDVLISNLIGGGVIYVSLVTLSLITSGGIGMGDVKLFSIIGFYTGIGSVIYIMLYSLFIAGIFSVFMLITKKLNSKDKLAFGPYIYFGYVIAILLGTI